MYRGDFAQTYMVGGNTHTETKLDSLQKLHEYRTAQFQNRIEFRNQQLLFPEYNKVSERRHLLVSG